MTVGDAPIEDEARQIEGIGESIEMATETRSEIRSVQDILRAACFAGEEHASERRKGAAQEPYINHLLEVAGLVANALTEPDTDLVIAAFLHDIIENTRVSKDDLLHKFGPDVAELVAEVTDDRSLPQAERKRRQIVHASHLSVRAQTIKLADKISNLRGILNSPPADWGLPRKREYFAFANKVVDGFTAPNPFLKAEFDTTQRKFENLTGLASQGKNEVPRTQGES